MLWGGNRTDEIINEFEIEQPAPPGVGDLLEFFSSHGKIHYKVERVIILFDSLDTERQPSEPKEALVYAAIGI